MTTTTLPSQQDSRRHLSTIRCFLNDVPKLDWSRSLEVIHRDNSVMLRKLANDRTLLRELISRTREDPYLWSKCEEDIVEDKLVLWDDMERGLRIRLRMAVTAQQRLAHSHRFSFSNLVLHGQYTHWLYRPLSSFDEHTRLEDVATVAQRIDRAGDIFTIHHATLHSTPFPGVGTVSLVLRGNPVKERAPVMFKEARGRAEYLAQLSRGAQQQASRDEEPAVASVGDFFWRVGEASETAERRAERQMRVERVDYWLEALAKLAII